jgi:Xaa-Pro aminopeptidase
MSKFNEPKFTEFPIREYETRYKRAKELMRKCGIDVLLVFEKENVEYFTGFISTHWNAKSIQPAVGVLPMDGEPVLVIPEFFRGVVEETSWISNVVGQTYPHSLRREREFPLLVTKAIKDLGFADKMIGIETGHSLYIPRPLEDIETIKKDLPNAKFVSAADVIWGCRMFKSPLEIERMKKSSLITGRAYEKVAESIEVGMTEKEIAKVFNIACLEEGAEYWGRTTNFMYLSSGPERYHMVDSPPTDKKIQPGDMVIFDCGAMYRGYCSDVARCAYAGKPTEEHKRYYDAILRAFGAGVEELMPSKRVCDVYNAVANVFHEVGWKTGELYGHGIGLDTHELPWIRGDEEMPLQPGMTLSLEDWVGFKREKDVWGGSAGVAKLGIFCIEDTFLVTEKGHEKFPSFELPYEELWTI